MPGKKRKAKQQREEIQELWDKVDEKWYTDADKYWKKQDCTVDGMLGGYGELSINDARDSTAFISPFIKGDNPKINTGLCLDCGAGIGRVSEVFLLKIFDKVDLCEQNQQFVDTAKEKMPKDRVERFICSGLQDFNPEQERYDCIWVQWVLNYLTDDDLVAFFQRCKYGLKKGGMLFCKENVCVEGFVVDTDDSSVTRSTELFEKIFKKSGMKLVKKAVQKDFPQNLYPVYMFALEYV
eukprot:Lithocolla_globosa_v1_NODE_3555_length_1638_cov_24.590651.p2 type:complete len:238 gc:universal NODE_3555_length_1638_cov_24.590651:749-36(-)